MFTPTWGSDPTSLVLFKWVETTHQFFWSCRVTRCQQSHQQIVRISQGCRWWMRIGIGGCWHCWKILVNQDLQCFNHFPWWILSVDWRWDGEIMARYNVLICTVSYIYMHAYVILYQSCNHAENDIYILMMLIIINLCLHPWKSSIDNIPTHEVSRLGAHRVPIEVMGAHSWANLKLLREKTPYSCWSPRMKPSFQLQMLAPF